MSGERVHHLFYQTAKAFPERLAIASGDGGLTYEQLYHRARHAEAVLRRVGVGTGHVVGILSERAADIIPAMIGVLASGGAFMPLDPWLPGRRLTHLMESVVPSVVLGDSDLLREVPDGIPKLTLRWDDSPHPVDDLQDTSEAVDPDQFCYIYFTSGSTGAPKGIAGRLKAIDHFVKWETALVNAGGGLRTSQLTAPGFDAYLRDVFLPLTTGGTLCVPESRYTMQSPEELVAWLERERVELIHCVPTLFRVILQADLGSGSLPHLKHVLLSGEVLLAADVKRWMEVFGSRVGLVNLYGPSETTMVKFFHEVNAEDCSGTSIPIGKPMPGCRALVVDRRGRPCPAGAIGEIYIRTPYRTLGYFNDAELTNTRFIRNPWSDDPSDIVYKTGDLGRVRADGVFEFLGREDHQVKVNGARVELGEIENAIRNVAGVTDVAVVDRRDPTGNGYLCAFYVADGEVSRFDFRETLLSDLPMYMVPTDFVHVRALPRALTGKVDRRALQEMPLELYDPSSRVAPRSAMEAAVAELYGELLHLPQVGVEADFFRLGGRSLMATQLLARVRQTWGVEVPLRLFFRQSTVEELALIIEESLLNEIEGTCESAPGGKV